MSRKTARRGQAAAALAASTAAHLVNGWALYTHPLFDAQYDALIAAVAAEKRRDPAGYRNSDAAKMLYAVDKLINEVIPANPADKKFRQGEALGPANKHWFRAKFYQQFRLFFRFDSASKTIVYVWLNDEDTLRAYGSKTDAYATFRRMLASGNPPGSLEALLKASSAAPKK